MEAIQHPVVYTTTSPTPGPIPKSPISGGVLNGKATSLPKPAYPAMAKAARASGIVTVQVTVDESGNVISARAVSGHPMLQQAAVQAAYKAKFSQTKLSGQPVKIRGIINYNFQLIDPPAPEQSLPPGRQPPGRPRGRPPEE